MGDSGEKTEEATPEKLRKAKEEGQVPKSQDFVAALGFIIGFMGMAALFGTLSLQIKDYTLAAVDAATRSPNTATISKLLKDAIPFILQVSLPVGALVFVMGIFSNVMQTGFFLAFKVLIPKIDKINPINGLKGMFKMKKVIDLIKNLVKMFLVGYIGFATIRDALWDMSLIVTLPFFEGVRYSGGLLWDFMVKVCVVFLLIGAFDLWLARKQFNKEMMMSKHDVKQEYKQMEGDPHMKHQRKELAHELLFSGSMEQVKNADAVVVNPDHIAVAIKYDKDSKKAPTVVAKGMRIHAEKIKELAKQYGVPILRNVPLAQELNKLEIGEEVPEDLYEAVAEVLAFVYKLKEEQEAKEKERAARRGGRVPAAAAEAPAEGGAALPAGPGARGGGRLKGDK